MWLYWIGSVFLTSLAAALFVVVLHLLRGVGDAWAETLSRGAEPGPPPAESPPDTLVIAACNMAHGRGRKVSNLMIRSPEEVRSNVEGAARAILEAGADIVLVQEIDRDAFWSRRVNEVALLAEETGLRHVAYQPNYSVWVPGLKLCAGNAILSRFPVLEAFGVEYNTEPLWKRRFPGSKRGLGARIELPGGEHLLAQCHHFHPFRKGHRARQSALVVEQVQRFWSEDARPSAVILGGDFNMRAKEIRRSALAQLHWQALPPDCERFEPSFPAVRPMWALDHVFAQSEEWSIASRRVRPTLHSDHAFVFATLERVGAAKPQAVELEDIDEAALDEAEFEGEDEFEEEQAARENAQA